MIWSDDRSYMAYPTDDPILNWESCEGLPLSKKQSMFTGVQEYGCSETIHQRLILWQAGAGWEPTSELGSLWPPLYSHQARGRDKISVKFLYDQLYQKNTAAFSHTRISLAEEAHLKRLLSHYWPLFPSHWNSSHCSATPETSFQATLQPFDHWIFLKITCIPLEVVYRKWMCKVLQLVSNHTWLFSYMLWLSLLLNKIFCPSLFK